MKRRHWGALIAILFAMLVYVWATSDVEAQAPGTALKYSRVYGEWRYCYYFNGEMIIVERRLSCPRYAP